MMHTVKGFSVIDGTEVDVFLEFLCFLYDPENVCNLISGSSAFSQPSLDFWKFLVHVMLKPSMQDFKHDLTSMGNECDCPMVKTLFTAIIHGNWDEYWLFQSSGHCWVFQICWHTEWNTFITSFFRLLNSSGGIPSHPLALLTAVLPKAHLTSHSKMSGSGWLDHIIIVIWFIKIFLYSSSVYSFHLFLISSVFSRSLPFLSFIVPIFGWNFPLIFPVFLKKSLVFHLLFSSIFMHCSLKKAFLSLLFILWNSAFSWMYVSLVPLLFAYLLSSAVWKTSSDNHFAFLLFLFFGMVLLAVSCTISCRTCSSSGTLFIRSNPLNLFVTSTAYS